MRALLALLLLALPADAQDRPDPMVMIEPTPRLPCSGSEPACKINAALLALDQDALMLPCGQLDEGTIAAEGLDPGRDPLQMYYAHWVDVTLHGANFLALLRHTEAHCPGGAHGWTDLSTALFDLESGAPVDPLSLLPAALIERPGALGDLYLAQAGEGSGDCAGVVAAETADQPARLAFLAYPEPGGLTLIPNALPHAAQTCADPVTLPAALLRDLGADPRLLQDIGG